MHCNPRKFSVLKRNVPNTFAFAFGSHYFSKTQRSKTPVLGRPTKPENRGLSCPSLANEKRGGVGATCDSHEVRAHAGWRPEP